MADDQKQRFYRPNEIPPRGAPPASSATGGDPLAELARLIGQTDPFGEFARENARRAPPPSPPVAPPPPPSFGPSDYFDAPDAPPPQPVALQEPTYAGRARQPYDGAASFPPAHEAVGAPPGEAGEYEQEPYHPGDAHLAPEDEGYYEDEQPARKSNALMAIAVVFALALVGTAGAFGYRAMFGTQTSRTPPVIKADTAPSKIVPAASNKTPNKLIYDRVADRGQDEKLVSREEQPVEIKPADIKTAPPLATIPPPQASAPPAAAQPGPGSGVISTEPRKVHTIAIRPDQADAGATPPVAAPPAGPAPQPPMAAPAPVRQAPPAATVSGPPPVTTPAPPQRPSETRTASVPPPPAARHAAEPAPRNAPLSLSPGAEPARTTHTASVAARAARTTASTGGYVVQVSSQRSEAEAQAAYRSLQAKYPNLLGGRQAMIRKVDLGSKGTYYRALVGPFANGNEATQLCSGLKASGGQCIIQRN
jgi:hypothetical protein